MATSDPSIRAKPEIEEKTLKMKATNKKAAVTLSSHKLPEYGACSIGKQVVPVQNVNNPKLSTGVFGA